MAGIYIKLLSGIKGILSGSRYGRRDVGKGDLSPCVQEEPFTVHNCSLSSQIAFVTCRRLILLD